jgi:excisionase family DNA binding protein
MNERENWSTLKDVQEYLGVGRESILQWINKRNMPAYKVGRLWKFKLSEGFALAEPPMKAEMRTI